MGLFRIREAFSKNGIGQGMTAKDVAEKHGVPVEKIEEQIEKGIKVELEHTSDLDKAREIAMDHLAEFHDYYDRLTRMEDEAKAEEKRLGEEFAVFLSGEIDQRKADVISVLSESEVSSDPTIAEWADWKLTKFNLRNADDSFLESFLTELTGDKARVASMGRRQRVHEIMEAADSMPKKLKAELSKMDGLKGQKRSRVLSSVIKKLKIK
jgi:hypothetical protein